MAIKFGLEQQGHIETIEKMATEWESLGAGIQSISFWERVGIEIGWDAFTACAWYCRYLRKQIKQQ